MPESQFDWVCKYLCRVSMPSVAARRSFGATKRCSFESRFLSCSCEIRFLCREKRIMGSTAFANAEKGRHLFGSKEMFRAKVESMLKKHVSIDQCYV